MKYFIDKEFACKCGCGRGFEWVHHQLINKLSLARDIAGVPFVLNSAVRCPEHNKAVGGSVNSSHMKGMAVDIAVNDAGSRFKILHGLIQAGFNRIGVYQDFIHADVDQITKPGGVCWVGKP
jgi:zinc D-Ala-D-Ala carboxypeptidase